VGRMLRPKASVLPESAMVPAQNLIQPPPNQFTHQVAKEQPYYFTSPKHDSVPDGFFVPTTRVLVIRRDGRGICHVADGRGLYVATAFKGLRPIL
jgi:hypothetical protein